MDYFLTNEKYGELNLPALSFNFFVSRHIKVVYIQNHYLLLRCACIFRKFLSIEMLQKKKNEQDCRVGEFSIEGLLFAFFGKQDQYIEILKRYI
jgi:hypothetical protein